MTPALAEIGPLWMVGCGNMGGAMLRGWIDAGLSPSTVTVIKPSARNVPPGATHLTVPPPDGPVPAIVVLAVKPSMLDAVAPMLAPVLAPETLLLSVLAGAELVSLRRRFPTGRVVRMMPNTPCAIREGVLALQGDAVDEGTRETVEALAAPLGRFEWIGQGTPFDAVTTVMGCGPAFLFRFIDALAEAGIAHGVPPEQARRMALATVRGSALLAAQSDESPAALADRVASPGGSTRAGLNVLDDENALKALMHATVAASVRRDAEMAAAAR